MIDSEKATAVCIAALRALADELEAKERQIISYELQSNQFEDEFMLQITKQVIPGIERRNTPACS